MARRKKNMTYEEELTYLDSEISKTEFPDPDAGHRSRKASAVPVPPLWYGAAGNAPVPAAPAR